MDFEQDYIMRMIKDMVRALASVILGKKFVTYELPEENKFTDTDFLYKDLIQMADQGKINEAENILIGDMYSKDEKYLEMAIGFYQHINTYTDDFLEANKYSRKEILEGIQELARANGVTGLDGLTEEI